MPFRFFELGFGGIIAFAVKTNTKKWYNNKIHLLVLSALILVIFHSLFYIGQIGIGHVVCPIATYPIGKTNDTLPTPGNLMLLLTVFLTCAVIYKKSESQILTNDILKYFGKRCYSLYIWHQFVLAFYRNIISDEITIYSVFICLTLTLIISELSYVYIEQKIVIMPKSLVVWLLLAIAISIPAGFIYLNGGVYKDIPEAEMKVSEVKVGISIAHVDVSYQYDKDFKNIKGKWNVLILGNSFARDFMNILMESKYASKMDFSYHQNGIPIERLKKADYIFSFEQKEKIDSLSRYLKSACKVFGIGTKNFGNCNNQVYSKRFFKGYYEITNELPTAYRLANEIAKKHWGDNYIDLIKPAMVDSARVRVFTDDHKYISQDCRHLTKAGARWYASVIDWNRIFD